MNEGTAASPLVCPRCALSHPISERFCSNCGMPLVYAGTREEEPVTDAHERARKVRPQYARGDLVRVTGARNMADGEMVQSILLDHGTPRCCAGLAASTYRTSSRRGRVT
jgi:predicted amidophosphoribosyltransferase